VLKSIGDLWCFSLVGLASEDVDIPPALDESTTNTVHAWGSIGLGSDIVRAERHDLLCAALVGGCERLVERREDKVGRVGARVDSDLMKLALDIEAEVVEIKIIQIILEGVLNFLSDLQEAEKEERGEGSSRDGNPLHGINNLERQEEEIQPERHAEVSLVSERQRGVADALQVGQSILKHTNVVHDTGGDGRL